MRNEPNLKIEQYRVFHPELGAGEPGKNYGYFEKGPLRIVSSGSCGEPSEGPEGWEHVSVSCAGRCPTWQEMKFVKELFWRDDETVIQFHPRKESYINRAEFCLHLWRKIGYEFPLPPTECV